MLPPVELRGAVPPAPTLASPFAIGDNDENSWAPELAARHVNLAHSHIEPSHLPLKGYMQLRESGLPRDVSTRSWPSQFVECLGKRHRVVGQHNNVGPNDDVIWRAGVVDNRFPQQ